MTSRPTTPPPLPSALPLLSPMVLAATPLSAPQDTVLLPPRLSRLPSLPLPLPLLAPPLSPVGSVEPPSPAPSRHRARHASARPHAPGWATIAATAAALLAPVPLTAQQVIDGPALAPLTEPLTAGNWADGTEVRLRPVAATPPSLTDATPDTPEGPGSEATVLADQVTVTRAHRLEASGGVVVWYQGTRLIAQRVIYDGSADQLLIEGPIHLSRPADRNTDRETVLVADAAELDGELRAGILRGARLVLARELQMAAREVRVEDRGGAAGRLTVLDRVAASSCRVCAGSPTPLWEIRARRITHDSAARSLTFDHPQFRAFGLPLVSAPFSVTAPDPTVDRMSGFLRPQFRTTSRLGFGMRLPWFQTLGDHADLTLTPYLSFGRTATLDARYRRAFSNGALIWQGAVSRDDIRSGIRGYSLAAAEFALSGGYRLGAQLQWASDRDYLSDYGISDADRLWSGLTLDRVTRDRLEIARAGTYRTLRAAEQQEFLPTQVVDAWWLRRLTPPEPLGGQAILAWGAHGHRRPSGEDGVGRDVARASLSGAWRREWVLQGGVLAEAAARFDADIWQVGDDPALRRLSTRAVPTLGATLRWPLLRASVGGGTDVLEPVLALAWSPRRGSDGIPNEDSLFPELDEGNIYALDRLPGRDRTETGLRVAMGIGWTRITPGGSSLNLTAARLWYQDQQDWTNAATTTDKQPYASTAGGVAGAGGWLLAANLQHASGLAAAGRALLSPQGDLASGELRMGWITPQMQLSGGYAYAASADSDVARLSQLGFDLGWQMGDGGWWGRATGRYDLDLKRAQKAALGVSYRNECLTLEAAVNRSWDAPGGDPPDTGLDLSVRLGGFGRESEAARRVPVARRSCIR